MNAISFLVSNSDTDVSRKGAIIPVIDSISLIDYAAAFESEHQWHPAGGYGGLIPEFFNYGPFDQYLLGASNTTMSASSKPALLGCDCGEVGCWPLLAKITASTEQVVWSEFEQPFRQDRDYSQFGPFTFNRNQYDQALRDLKQQLDICKQSFEWSK